MEMDFITDGLNVLKESNLLREFRIIEGAQGTHVEIDGKVYLSFC